MAISAQAAVSVSANGPTVEEDAEAILAGVMRVLDSEWLRCRGCAEKRLRSYLAGAVKQKEATPLLLARLVEKVDELGRKQVAPMAGGVAREPMSEEETSRVFAFMMGLKPESPQEKGRLFDVFVLTVLKKESQRATAKACGCSLGKVAKRVGELKAMSGLSITQLRAHRSRLLEMMASVKGQQRRMRKPGSRPGAFSDEEPGDEEEDRAPREEYRYEEDGNAD